MKGNVLDCGVALLTSAQRPEILCRLGHLIIEELEDYPALICVANTGSKDQSRSGESGNEHGHLQCSVLEHSASRDEHS